MLARDAVVLAQVPFGLIPEVLDAVDVSPVPRRKGLGMIDPVMLETRHIQDVVAAKRVGVDDRVQFHVVLHDRQQRQCLGVRNHRGVDLAATLEDTEHRHLARSATASAALAHPAQVTLVQLDDTANRIVIFDAGSDDLAQPVVEQNDRVPVYADQFRGGASRRSCYKVLTQSLRLANTELGALEPRFAILDRSVS